MTTTVIKSIGSAPGRDYATIQAWFDAAPADLVVADQIWRGECYNDSLFTSGSYNHTNMVGKAAGPNNYFELTTGPGQSFRDHPDHLTNPVRFDQSKGVALSHGQGGSTLLVVGVPHFRVSNLQLRTTAGQTVYAGANNTTGCRFENLLCQSDDPAFTIRNPNLIRNCAVIVTGGANGIDGGFGNGSVIVNTTVVRPSDKTAVGTAFYTAEAGGMMLVNCAGFGFPVFTNSTVSGSSNNASDVAITVGTNNQASLAYANQFINTLTATADFRVKAGSNLINAGATDLTDLPSATDITGTPRAGSWDIGAWEIQPVAAAPLAPTNVVATAGNGLVSVAFTDPVGSYPAITDHIVTLSTGQTAHGASSPIVVTAPNGTAVTATVVAINSSGTGPASTSSNSVTPFLDNTAPTYVSGATNATGTEITLTFSEPLAATTLPTAVFSIGRTIGSVVVSGNTVKLLGITSTINGGETVTLTYAKPVSGALADASGNQVASFGPVTITNIVPVRPLLQGYLVKVYGDTDIADFSTPDQLASYIAGLNCVTLASNVMIYLDKNLDAADKYFGPNSTNDSYYVTMRPMPGKGFDDLEPDTAPGAIGTLGIDVNCADAQFTQGILLEGLRIRSNGFRGMQRGRGTHAGNSGGMHGCRMRHTGTGMAMLVGNLGASFTIADCLFEVDAANTSDIISNGGDVRLQRNTFVRLNGAVGYAAINHEYAGGHDTDNVFAGCGSSPYRNYSNGQPTNNYTNTATASPAVTYISGPFFESASNYRPAAGSGLLGVGSRTSVSVNDNNGNNRGLLPDAGAFQRTPAIPLPMGSVTSQTLDGQSLTVQLAVSRAPNSGSMVLTPANPANGAQTVGPVSLVFSGSTASVTVDDVPSGDYLAPSIILVNAGGTNAASGAVPLSIMGVDNLVFDTGGVGEGGAVDPVTPGAAPTISISTTGNAILSGKNATISGLANMQGDATGHVDLYLDPQPSGTPVALGSAPVSLGVWIKQAIIPAGLFRLRAVATANGQTATASTGNLRVLGLTGTVGVPVA